MRMAVLLALGAGVVGGGAFLLGRATAPRPVLVAGPAVPGTRVPNTDEPYPKLDVFAKVLAYVKNNYVEPVNESALVYGAVRGMVATLDPHTVFMDPREYQALRDDTSGEFGGLGIEITQRGDDLVVLAPIDETPAARAGIRAGDVIAAIDGVSARRMTVGDASGRLRGAPGTQVVLRLMRTEFKSPRDFPLVRDRIRVVSVESRLIDGAVGYVRIKSFQDRTDQQLGKAIETLRAEAGKNLKGFIVDLRSNPGGLLDQGVLVADRFLKKGVIVTTKGRGGRHAEEERASDSGNELDFPLVLLVNAGTASASEIVAGALQDHRRAVLFGTPTFGKGSVQTVIELDDGSGLKLTIARYYTPNGRSIQESGIMPDVAVAATADEALVLREATLPGHMKNDAPSGQSVVAVEAEKVVPSQTGGSAIADAQLKAAVDALRGWDAFSRALQAARADAGGGRR